MEHTSDMEDNIINILDLPEEILRIVLKFVPNHANLSLVCSKFYEISCQSKYFKITAKMLLDRDFANLVENSRRRFNTVYLSLMDNRLVENSRQRRRRLNTVYLSSMANRLLLRQKHIELLQLVGKDIKILGIFDFFKLEISLRNLLELLPNLEKISLRKKVLFLKPEPEHRTLLNLPKLEELSIHYDINYVKTFNYLPNDVLRKIDVTCYQDHVGQTDLKKIFSSQRRLEEMSFCSCFFLIAHKSDNLEPDFKGLKLANFPNLQKLSMRACCCNEVSLEYLKGLSSVSVTSLRIDIMSSSEVITAPTLIALNRNLPQLEYLRLETKLPFEMINKVIEHFSNLKMFYFEVFYTECRYVFQDNLANESLTTLIIDDQRRCMPDDIPKLLAACKNLKCFKTSMRIDAENIKEILTHQPKLTRLHLFLPGSVMSIPLSANFVEALKTFGPNLNEFSCLFRNFEEGITENVIRNELKQKFKNIEFSKLPNFTELKILKMNNGFPFGPLKV